MLDIDSNITKLISFENCDGSTNDITLLPTKPGSVEDIFLISSTVFYKVWVLYFLFTSYVFLIALKISL